MQPDWLAAGRFDFRLDLVSRGPCPRVDSLERIPGERPPGRTAQQGEIELLHREILELVDEYCAEMRLVEPRDGGNAEQALCVPEEIVVVQLVRLLSRPLHLLREHDLRRGTSLLDSRQHLGVRERSSLDLA